MNSLIVFLVLLLLISLLYVFILSKQIRRIQRQLAERRDRNTNQPISLELLNTELSLLAANINQCLEIGQQAVSNSIQKENTLRETIASISHDLRTPLTAIKGYLQLLEQDNLTDGQMEKLVIIKKHVDEMALLTEHFWEYSYFSLCQQDIPLKRINLANLTAENLANYVSQLENKGLSVTYKHDKSLFVRADENYTTRILQNLIQNCITHSVGDIEIELKNIGNVVILSVKNPVQKDIDLNVQHIFDRFYTADKSRGKASGLGLTVVNLLITKMGGRAIASLENAMLEIQIEFLKWMDDK
ncbi:sensor histidine kinase [Dielma fastidiosa]|uniref:histidine kinase n=1 Tax=Dielma fastidiosa TaxID=1034346 RepID=A0A318L0Y2_9FIRM|nr:HAMP domain-containing sensor histidine kinase [Dielma fastidiosa]PXX81605.1 signal transduction histidine kinase [Dielma fastidiosa]